ncbi:MAG: pilus assembly PilX N-terminal domain-containing protein [Candidatus Eisenbacteria bacterium]|nr:pilus assembly PilX N-terminal domain-containing protein [Candidatus Eisenbacteria bacterium]
MATEQQARTGANERGNVMVGALLMLLLISAMGVSYVALSKTETGIAGSEKRHVQSMFSAEAGVAEAVMRMSSSDSTIYFGQDPNTTPTPGWGRYMVQSNGNSSQDPSYDATLSDSLSNDGDGTIDESGEYYAEVLSVQDNANRLPYPWVRVSYRLDASRNVILYGDHDLNAATDPRPNLVRGFPIIKVASEGNQGTSQRLIEVEAVRAPFTVPNAAIYSESDNFKFNGTQFLISGQDWDPVTDTVVPGSSEVQGIETTANPTNIINQLGNNQTNNVEGSGAEPSVAVATVNYDIDALIAQYSPLADNVHAGGTVSNGQIPDWGGWNDYRIVHVTADLHITGDVVGGGLLLLEGDLTCTGQFTWYGLIINTGEIAFSGGGAGIHLFGALMSEGGISTNTVGGNADIKYSSEALSKLTAFNPYRVSAWTELP